jgi:hypothetical protein
MDILTLGKMNAMARNTDLALELMANHLYESQQEICDFQAGNIDAITAATAAAMVEISTFVGQNTTTDVKHFYIYNTSHWGANNGGCCLQWTVPEGVSIINFEILSGGGPGGSAGYDYDIGHGGAGGNYNEKTLCRAAGDFISVAGSQSVYSLCSGGTSSCSCCTTCNRACRHGCSSYVNGSGLSNFCAIGGHGGSTSWDVQSNCYNCHIGGNQCDRGVYNGQWSSHNCNDATRGGDMCFRGASAGMSRGYSCCNEITNGQGSPSGPFTAPWTGSANHYCAGDMACCAGHSIFPGGGGVGDGNSSTTPCVGGFGAGGLVKVTYQ